MRTALVVPSVAFVALVLSVAVDARACPDCAEGRVARAQVVHDVFDVALVGMVAPFLAVGLASRWALRRKR